MKTLTFTLIFSLGVWQSSAKHTLKGYIMSLRKLLNEITFFCPDLWNLGIMAASTIDCDIPIFPIPYGCHCGINWEPEDEIPPPIDDFDHACMLHDHCYDKVGAHPHCGGIHEYLVSYEWKHKGTEVLASQ